MDEPAEPRRMRGQALIDMGREDLDLFAIEDLNERIALLEAEISRTKAQIDRKHSGRAAAEGLFKR